MTKLQKEYKEAEKKLLQTKWKVTTCISGTSCWCRLIVPVKKITYSDQEDMYVVGSGCITKTMAMHIVKMHNQNLKVKRTQQQEYEETY